MLDRRRDLRQDRSSVLEPQGHRMHGEARGIGRLWERRLRAVTGVWLFAFVVGHFLNHALGLVSLDALERGRHLFLAFWRLPPVEASALLALLVHPALGLARLWRRRTLRMRPLDAAQLLLGLAIPFFLTVHLLGTGVLARCCGLDDSYTYVLSVLWPDGAARQSTFLIVVWVHGCVGLHQRLRLHAWYDRAKPWLAALAVLLPVLALLGFAEAGRTVRELSHTNPQILADLAREQHWPSPELAEGVVRRGERWIVAGFVLLLGLVAAGRALRNWRERHDRVRVVYDGGIEITVPRGLTLLEASRLLGVPHASVCGGRGRCSTCRVRVLEAGGAPPPPAAAEARVLARIGAGPDVRLACQLRLAGPLRVVRLVPPAEGPRHVLRPLDPALGREQAIVVLFADLRGFTRFAEGRLPWDTVHLLNRYFAATGRAVERAGGRVDKFVGDGVMALFGLDGAVGAAARAALAAAREMSLAIRALNRELADDLAEPLRIGIGIHLGPAIVGELGYGRAVGLTAIGDTVNVASRLEQLTKELGCELVVAEELVRRAGLDLPGARRHEVTIRGRAATLPVLAIADAGALPVGDARGPPPARGRRLLPRFRVRGEADRTPAPAPVSDR